MNAPQPVMKQRAALYLRVSTARQAEHDVSIPDQKRQGETYCEARGYDLVETYVEPGASATNDKRPEFQRLIEAGTAKPSAFDIVVVHSFSRFFRDHFELEFYVRKLAKNGVKLVSMTQELGDDPMHVMMRQIMALFDEYQSKENAKHTLRALKENARQGFWNGSLPPVGYRVVDAEKRGAKVKKVLEIDPLHADTIRLMFQLALNGDGESGRMGVKAIATYLNERKLYTRTGGRWGVGTVHRILTRRTYIGEHEWGKSYKDGTPKQQTEVITVAVPPIVDLETFDAVQKLLKRRAPMVTPGRTVSGPTLLTGIAFCAECGGAMTLRTSGKAKHYRYYTCSTAARQGKTGCLGRTIRMDKLDHLVAEHLERRLLNPKRLEDLLSAHLDRREERDTRRRDTANELTKRAAEAEQRLKRLYGAIESGIADLDDPSLRERVVELTATRDQARIDAERAKSAIQNAGQHLSPKHLRRMAKSARQKMRGKDGGFRRDHLRALAQRVEVADREVRIMGSHDELIRALASSDGVGTAANGVRTYVPGWRTGRDSNPRDGFPPTHFPGARLRPLGHLSAGGSMPRGTIFARGNGNVNGQDLSRRCGDVGLPSLPAAGTTMSIRFPLFIALWLALAPMVFADVADMAPEDGWQVIATNKDFETLAADTRAAAKAGGLAVVTMAGPTGAAASRGIEIPGNRVIGLFNNDFAVRILRLSTPAMIEAPIRVYVTENADGTATLSYIPPSRRLAPYIAETPELAPIAAELDAAFAAVAEAAR